MTLLGHLTTVSADKVLACWAGTVSTGRHPYARADLLRFVCFFEEPGGTRYLSLCPYRPAAFGQNLNVQTLAEVNRVHSLRFEREPTYLIREGERRGRLARTSDLRIDENAEDQTVDMLLATPAARGSTAKYSLRRAENLFAAFQRTGDDIHEGVLVPRLCLSVRSQNKHLVPRGSNTMPGFLDQYDDVEIYDADSWYGQGVWCAEPTHLGRWFACPAHELEIQTRSLFISLENGNAA